MGLVSDWSGIQRKGWQMTPEAALRRQCRSLGSGEYANLSIITLLPDVVLHGPPFPPSFIFLTCKIKVTTVSSPENHSEN